MAAQEITKAIAEHLTKEEVHVYGRLSFWITLYYNKASLLEALVSNNVCSHDQFESFYAVRPSCVLSPNINVFSERSRRDSARRRRDSR